jgi:HlyD family secretion protein
VDRDISPQDRRRTLIRRWIVGLSAAAVVWLAGSWGFGLLRASVKRSQLRTAIVDVGPVDASISATGNVVPEVEQVISSPVDARVVKILKRAGAEVREGDPLLQLDVSQSVLALGKLDQDLAIKSNQRARAKLQLENTLSEIQSQVEVKKLQLESARLEHQRNRQLFKEGLISEELLNRSEVAERQAGIELARLEESRRNAQAANNAELEGLALESAKLAKDRNEASRVLDLATTRADRSGVLTWSLTEEGITIPRGSVVARLADLTSFRVDASVSDSYASRLGTGQPVQVRIDDTVLPGHISEVLPAVQNGVVAVRIALDDKSNPLLRPNLRVEVFIQTDHRDTALRVRKGVSTSGEGVQQVFVIRGSRAERTRVRFGIASFDFVEVAEGLREGDEVVVSDMTDYLHLSSIRVR